MFAVYVGECTLKYIVPNVNHHSILNLHLSEFKWVAMDTFSQQLYILQIPQQFWACKKRYPRHAYSDIVVKYSL